MGCGRRALSAARACAAGLAVLLLGPMAAVRASPGPAALSGRLVLPPLPAYDGTWRTAAHDLASTRYSPLAEIDTTNVSKLKEAWSWKTGIPHGHEAAPLYVDGRLYVVTPFPDRLVALELSTGKVLWDLDPRPDPAAQGIACCDLVNRGAAYDGGRLFFATLDDQMLAVDAATGKELWRTTVGDIAIGESMTMAPIVVKGKVLVGTRAESSACAAGSRRWTQPPATSPGAWSTGPDADVLIGPSFEPHDPQDRGKDLGVSSWPPDRWKIGGGNVWRWISYDAELDLVLYGTGNPGTWNPEQRPGENKWTAGSSRAARRRARPTGSTSGARTTPSTTTA